MEKATTSIKKKDLSGTLQKLKVQADQKESELIDVVTSIYESFKESQEKATDKVAAAAHHVKDSVEKHPWYYIGGAATLGLLLGGLISRRCCKDN